MSGLYLLILALNWFIISLSLPLQTSSLIITDPRITDTGIYYCNATDDTRYAVSNDTQLTVLGTVIL